MEKISAPFQQKNIICLITVIFQDRYVLMQEILFLETVSLKMLNDFWSITFQEATHGNEISHWNLLGLKI